MKGAQTEADSVSSEVYLSSVELGALLKLTDAGVARLARDGVLVRRPDHTTLAATSIRPGETSRPILSTSKAGRRKPAVCGWKRSGVHKERLGAR